MSNDRGGFVQTTNGHIAKFFLFCFLEVHRFRTLKKCRRVYAPQEAQPLYKVKQGLSNCPIFPVIFRTNEKALHVCSDLYQTLCIAHFHDTKITEI
jgi:hypothetical protein